MTDRATVWRRWATGTTLWAAALLGSAGCRGFGHEPMVPAEYDGLQQQRIAVLVAATDTTLYGHPQLESVLGRVLIRQLADRVPGAQVSDPDQIDRFAQANPYWQSMPGGELLKRLNVQRVVLVDISHYATREPGNAYLFQGTILGRVAVLADDHDQISNPVYATVVSARHPSGRVGRPDGDWQLMEQALINLFTQRVADRFSRHRAVRQ